MRENLLLFPGKYKSNQLLTGRPQPDYESVLEGPNYPVDARKEPVYVDQVQRISGTWWGHVQGSGWVPLRSRHGYDFMFRV